MLSRGSDSCRGNELLTWFDMFFDDVWVGLHTTVTIVRAPSTPNHRKWSIITVECGTHTALCKYEWRGILKGQHVTAGSDSKVFDQISHIHPWRPRLAAVHVAWQLAGCFSWPLMDGCIHVWIGFISMSPFWLPDCLHTMPRLWILILILRDNTRNMDGGHSLTYLPMKIVKKHLPSYIPIPRILLNSWCESGLGACNPTQPIRKCLLFIYSCIWYNLCNYKNYVYVCIRAKLYYKAATNVGEKLLCHNDGLGCHVTASFVSAF